MSYIFEEQIIKSYEVTGVWTNFMKFGSFNRVRKDIALCELCDTRFRETDSIHVAFIKGEENRLICDKCAEEMIQGGAEVLRLGRKVNK